MKRHTFCNPRTCHQCIGFNVKYVLDCSGTIAWILGGDHAAEQLARYCNPAEPSLAIPILRSRTVATNAAPLTRTVQTEYTQSTERFTPSNHPLHSPIFAG